MVRTQILTQKIGDITNGNLLLSTEPLFSYSVPEGQKVILYINIYKTMTVPMIRGCNLP